MWKLLYSDGKVFRENYANQWEVLISALKADGSRYKKDEALKVASGTVIYKNVAISHTYNRDQINDDGTFGDSYVKKTSVNVMEKFLLVDADFVPSTITKAWFIKNQGKSRVLMKRNKNSPT